MQRQQDYFEAARLALNKFIEGDLRAEVDSRRHDQMGQSLDSAYAELDAVSALITGAEIEIAKIREELESKAAEYRKRQDEVLVLKSQLRIAKLTLAKSRLEQERASRIKTDSSS
ncbi:MAG TPA: hypothetical protein VGR56_02920 [Nitrososphaerales archaeon]|nr:hypothetical protein [Nitrososphaerales archaeon]